MDTTTWSRHTVLALAPDDASARAGLSLAVEAKWSDLGGTDSAFWGECKGSGSKPYQTRIALDGPAFKCSCPSRKFPCKHSLALFFLYVDKAQLFSAVETPGWVSEWLESRGQREQKKVERAWEKADKPVDEAAQAKAAARRAERVEDGIDQLERWLQDLVRSGLATAPKQPYSHWDGMGQRLIDAQAPGLARLTRALGSISSSGAGWPERLLAACGSLQLLLDAYRNRDALSPALRAEVFSRVGFPTTKDEVLSTGERVTDAWLALGQTTRTDADGLRVQKTWLRGEATGRFALVLVFAHRAQALEVVTPNFAVRTGTLAFYPGLAPQRAIFAELSAPAVPLKNLPEPKTVPEQLADYRRATAANPWLEEYPLIADAVLDHGPDWRLVTRESKMLPVTAPDNLLWRLAGYAGGHGMRVFGLWNGEALAPLSADGHGGLLDIAVGERL